MSSVLRKQTLPRRHIEQLLDKYFLNITNGTVDVPNDILRVMGAAADRLHSTPFNIQITAVVAARTNHCQIVPDQVYCKEAQSSIREAAIKTCVTW